MINEDYVDIFEKWKQDFIETYTVKEETPETMIDTLYEASFINPVADSSGAILLASDNNILTL